jgi:DNA-binding MarR family transcriptional regulator
MSAKSRSSPSAAAIAERVHSAAIRLLRRLRGTDSALGLSSPKSSALSVLVFAGPQTLKDLAAAEQVRAPTMSRLIGDLEVEGLVTKEEGKDDRRVIRIAATAKGRTLLEAGRERRLEVLTAQIAALNEREQQTLARAADILARLNSDG